MKRLLVVLLMLFTIVMISCSGNDFFIEEDNGNPGRPSSTNTATDETQNDDINTDSSNDSEESDLVPDTNTSVDTDDNLDTDENNQTTNSDIHMPPSEEIPPEEPQEPDTFTITYDFNNGEKGKGSFPTEYEKSENVISIGVPKRTGYKFAGWEESNTPNERFYYYTIPKNTGKNISLRANWFEIPDYDYEYEGFRYVIKDDDTILIVDYVGEGKNLIIPKEINGNTVNEIGPYAFSGFFEKIKNIEGYSFISISLPETLLIVREGAFLGCDDCKPFYDAYKKDTPFKTWIERLVIEDYNPHLYDVLTNVRPAIGWYPYKKP